MTVSTHGSIFNAPTNYGLRFTKQTEDGREIVYIDKTRKNAQFSRMFNTDKTELFWCFEKNRYLNTSVNRNLRVGQTVSYRGSNGKRCQGVLKALLPKNGKLLLPDGRKYQGPTALISKQRGLKEEVISAFLIKSIVASAKKTNAEASEASSPTAK